MTQVFKKISDSQGDFKKLNANFDDIALELADRSGTWSSVGSASTNIAGFAAHTYEVDVIDTIVGPHRGYIENYTPIIPRFNIYVDGTTANHLYPTGTALNTGAIPNYMALFRIQFGIHRGVQQSGAEGEVASYWIVIHNDSGDAHDFYLDTDVFFTPSPELGLNE